MKKKRNIILCVISIIITVIFIIWYELCHYETYIGVICTIDDTEIGIIGTNQEQYIVVVKNVFCKDNEGKSIKITDLQVGDTIYIVNRKGFSTMLSPPTLSNIKYMQLLGSNLQTLSKNLSFISLDDSEEYLLSDLEWLKILHFLNGISFDSVTTGDILYPDKKYIPKGTSNYEFRDETEQIHEIIIEVYDDEIHVIINSYSDYSQSVTKIYDERVGQFKELINNIKNNN